MPKSAKVIFVVVAAICCPRLSHAAGLTVAWDPPSGGITAGYLLLYGTASHSYTQQVDVGNSTSYALNGLSDGTTYCFAVRAYDGTGVTSDPSAEVCATTSTTVPPVVTALALAPNVPPPQLVGTSVTWFSTATGGVAPYQFQWALYGAGQWTVWPWTVASTWTWTPSTPGSDYQVRVAVRSLGSSSTSGEMSQSVPFTVVSSITLSTSAFKLKGVTNANLTWSGASGSNVDVYRNSAKITTTTNDGAYADLIGTKGHGTYIYKVCAAGTATCSNNSTVVF